MQVPCPNPCSEQDWLSSQIISSRALSLVTFEYLQRRKCHKLFGPLFQCSSTLKLNFWNFPCCMLWALPLFPSLRSPQKCQTLLSLHHLLRMGDTLGTPGLRKHSSFSRHSHISCSSPLPATQSSAQFTPVFGTCIDLLMSFSYFWMLVGSIWQPYPEKTSCPTLDQNSKQSPSLLIHGLIRPSSNTLHISSVLQTPATSRGLSQTTLPDVPSLQLDTAPHLGPEKHWPWQNRYL